MRSIMEFLRRDNFSRSGAYVGCQIFNLSGPLIAAGTVRPNGQGHVAYRFKLAVAFEFPLAGTRIVAPRASPSSHPSSAWNPAS